MANLFDIPKCAHAPMYGDTVIVTCSRAGATRSVTFKACVFDCFNGEPISSEALETDREDIQVALREDDWHYVDTLKRGDIIIHNEKKYAFSSAKKDRIMGWVISAKGV